MRTRRDGSYEADGHSPSRTTRFRMLRIHAARTVQPEPSDPSPYGPSPYAAYPYNLPGAAGPDELRAAAAPLSRCRASEGARGDRPGRGRGIRRCGRRSALMSAPTAEVSPLRCGYGYARAGVAARVTAVDAGRVTANGGPHPAPGEWPAATPGVERPAAGHMDLRCIHCGRFTQITRRVLRHQPPTCTALPHTAPSAGPSPTPRAAPPPALPTPPAPPSRASDSPASRGGPRP